jgi:hypothetical protein
MRLIDADKLNRKKKYSFQIKSGVFPKSEYFIPANALFESKTVDAVPVVRCKDCWRHNSCGIEQAALAPIGFFCALGERKENKNDD